MISVVTLISGLQERLGARAVDVGRISGGNRLSTGKLFAAEVQQ